MSTRAFCRSAVSARLSKLGYVCAMNALMFWRGMRTTRAAGPGEKRFELFCWFSLFRRRRSVVKNSSMSYGNSNLLNHGSLMC
eukprot:466198-Prorocentrum_minimum.AAC.13